MLFLLAGLSLTVCPSAAQLKVEGLQLVGNGNASFGYSANASNQADGSSHSLAIGGDGEISGFYYTPSFASFHIMPYYDQSRANSTYQSIGDSSGVAADLNLFSGSRFPGAIGYQKSYNSTGTYGVSGTPNFTSHGNGDGYSVGWSALFPNMPTLSANFMAGSGTSNIYGTSAQSANQNKNFNLRSSYSILGFRLNGYYTYSKTHGDYPAFLTGAGAGTSAEISDSSSQSEGANLSHALPLHGSFAASFNHATYGGDAMGIKNSDNSTNTASASASFTPIDKVSLSLGTSFSSNLSGLINQQIVASGGTPVQTNLGETSDSYTANGSIGYAIARNMTLTGVATHVEQSYAGSSVGETYMSGTFSYNRKLFNLFSFSAGVLDNASDAGNGAVGMTGNLSFGQRIYGWNVSGVVSYAQNVQTLLVAYTTSNVNYGLNVNHRLGGRVSLNASYGGSQSIIAQQAGTGSSSQNIAASLGYRRYSLNGTYGKSNGISILTGNGLVTTSLPVAVSPLNQVLFNASNYGIGATAAPNKKIVISVSYSKANSSTSSSAVSSQNQTILFNSQIRYQFRRMSMMTGYTRFSQGISASGLPPGTDSSYFVGISRWFNMF